MRGRRFLDDEDNNRRLLAVLCEMERSDSQRASLAHRGEVYPSERLPSSRPRREALPFCPCAGASPAATDKGW